MLLDTRYDLDRNLDLKEASIEWLSARVKIESWGKDDYLYHFKCLRLFEMKVTPTLGRLLRDCGKSFDWL